MTWGSKPKKDGAGSASASSSSISPSSKSTPLRQRPLSPVSVFHRQPTPALPYAQPYKGLSTSITHIFTSPANTRVDCCALSCCGILQSDYNRYIILGKKAPTFKYRCLQYVLIPTMIFCIAGYCSVRIGNAFVAEVVCTALLFFCFAWIFLSCWRSTMKRSAARLELLRKVKGVSSGRVVESMDEDDELLGQSAFEMRCVHRFCGCYPHDCPNKEEDHGWSDAQISLHGRNDSTDFLAKLSRCFSNLCFGVFCKYHWQICGICALAQEGREIDSLVPREKRQLDYLTFQSYMAYYNPIRILRREQNGRLIHHYQALSKLSRMFLKTLGFVIFILSLVVLGFQPKSFKLGNLIVFVATFLQAFLVLYFIHWYWNRFDISLDAVIKYFACGFLITVSTVVVFEILESVLLGYAFQLLMMIMQRREEYQDVYESSFYLLDYHPMVKLQDSMSWWDITDSMTAAGAANNAKRVFQKEHPLLTTFFLFLSAYIVAALVEETTKYFGFQLVEHPDFLSEQELKKAAKEGIFNLDDDEEEDEYEHWYDCGGRECGYDSEESEEEQDAQRPRYKSPFLEESSKNKWVLGLRSGALSGKNGGEGQVSTNNGSSGPQKQQVTLEPCTPRSCNSIGAAITIAMISVALGYACCENLIYIFIYSGSSIGSEIGVLIARSLFPVHPLCAAIQSIGVCKQQLENDKCISLARILFPSILLHGSYDFSLMTLNFYAGLNQNDNEAEDQLQQVLYALLGLFLSLFFVLSGVLYYVKESRAQKGRLEQVDNARNFLGVYS